MTTAVAPRQAQSMTIRDILKSDAFKGEISKVLPDHCKPDRMLRVALTALTRTPKLANCTQQSFAKCLLDCSALGLEPDGRRAHLIPYGTECTLIVDYKGLAELAMRSGIFSQPPMAQIVCEHDEFEWDRGQITKHKIDWRKPRGNCYAVYCIAYTKDGGEIADVMTRDEVEAVRKRSRAANNGPWVTDWNEMAKKTVFRRMSKWLPLSADLAEAFERDDDVPADIKRPETTGVSLSDLMTPKLAAEPEQNAEPPEDAEEAEASVRSNSSAESPDTPGDNSGGSSKSALSISENDQLDYEAALADATDEDGVWSVFNFYVKNFHDDATIKWLRVNAEQRVATLKPKRGRGRPPKNPQQQIDLGEGAAV